MLQIENPYAPMEEIKLPAFANKGISFFLKREDLSHPFISGNKWRKLKFHLIAAWEQNKHTLVTYGGAYSNHLLATAAAGAKYGFATFGFVRGELVKNPLLDLCELFGMKLTFVPREAYKNKDQLFSSNFGSNQNVLNIPEGGGGHTGELGMEAVIEDLLVGPWNLKMEISKEKQHPVLHLITSVGTGSSLRGLLNGIQRQQLPIKAHGIVVLKGAEEMANDFSMFDSNNYELHHQFHGGGYGKINQETKDYIKEFASQTGILLDPIYEAKMMIGITTLINENYFEPGAQICALHNGGLVGLLSGKV